MLPNTFTALAVIFREATVLDVRFTKAIENSVTYAEANMLATISKFEIRKHVKDGQAETCLVTCNYLEYRAHNKQLESPTYPLKAALTPNAWGTATEAGMYSDKEVLMIDASHDPNVYFTPVGDSLIGKFLELREGTETYIQWLEKLVNKINLSKLYGK